MRLTLPEPSPEEQAHSHLLCDKIAGEILGCDGYIPFQRYMELALYAPGLGYYMAGASKFGEAGDFVTAPEISPLFSDCLALQAAQVLQQVPKGSVLECGAGRGVMAADILLRLEQLGALPERYYILELSAELQQRQQQTLSERAAHLLDRVTWLQQLDGFSMRGVVVANELLDAMPVTRFRLNDGQLFELGVGLQNEGFVWKERPVGNEHRLHKLHQEFGDDWPSGYESEFNVMLPGWMSSIAAVLQSGAMLLCDYGYTANEYYSGERSSGTLIGHYRHRALDDPFYLPGLVDLSASVDFSAVANAAEEVGFELAGYTSQALFLMGLDLQRWYAERLSATPGQELELSQQVKQLTLPSEMGERFQVIGLTKSLDCALRGFDFRDLSHRL